MSTVHCTISFVDGDQLKIMWDRPEDAAIRAAGVIDKILGNENLTISSSLITGPPFKSSSSNGGAGSPCEAGAST